MTVDWLPYPFSATDTDADNVAWLAQAGTAETSKPASNIPQAHLAVFRPPIPHFMFPVHMVRANPDQVRCQAPACRPRVMVQNDRLSTRESPASGEVLVISKGTTHEVHIDPGGGIVVKRFRSWSRNEPVREWTALTLLAEFAPGLAPVPISADLSGDCPTLAMSWLPGVELGSAPITPAQASALADGLERLWRSVPSAEREFPSAVPPNPVSFTGQVRTMVADGPVLGNDPVVARAYATAVAWLDHSAAEQHSSAGHHTVLGRTVLGHGDPCLANFLWDDGQVRFVDFEDSGPSDRAFELAILTEHISAWSDAGLDANEFLSLFGLTRAEENRVHEFRSLAALFWLIMLRPGSTSSTRNPPGTLERQAQRLLELLG
jgi:Phosphotransferase enzyme family